jgi:hypothetical protein
MKRRISIHELTKILRMAVELREAMAKAGVTYGSKSA